MDIHGGEDVRVDNSLLPPTVLAARVDGVGIPVGPEQGVAIQRQGEGVGQLALHYHLPAEGMGEVEERQREIVGEERGVGKKEEKKGGREEEGENEGAGWPDCCFQGPIRA